MQTLNTLKLLNLPDLYGNSLQIYECYWSIYEKLGKSFVFKNVVIGSASKSPSVSSCTGREYDQP